MEDFSGSKIAYLLGQKILVYKRDNIPDIIFPNMWDLPGGGRENDETPEQCALRELGEEFGLHLSESRLIYKIQVPNHARDGVSYFFVIEGRQVEVDNIVFGDEGQYWKMMAFEIFLSHPEVIGDLKNRLNIFLNSKE